MDHETIIRTIQECLELKEPPLLEDHMNSIENWDSLNHLHLIITLENQLGIKFKSSKIPNLVSVKAIIEEVEDNIG